MISPTQLQEFKRIYKEHFNEELTDAEALDQATKLLNMMKAVYRSLPEGHPE